jgi:hypothetical protein
MRERQVVDALANQLDAADPRLRTETPEAGERQDYEANATFWDDAIRQRVRSGTPISLRGFWISEWLPLSPGLFHTPQAQAQRKNANSHVMSGKGRARAEEMLRREGLPVAEVHRLMEAVPRGATYVYDPYGKAAMLAGGVGTVRLAERWSPDGTVWLLGASANATMHEGVVVALPADVYGRHIDEIASRGAAWCQVAGELRTLESHGDLAGLWASGIPRAYILVEELILAKRKPPKSLLATGAVVIESERPAASRHGPFYSAYVSFVPGDNPTIHAAVRWLDDVYAGEFLGGRVVTDFDQQVARFDRAPFSVSAIATGRVDRAAALTVVERVEPRRAIYNYFVERIDQINTEVALVSEQRTITIQSGAQINAPVTIADSIESSFNRIESGAGDPAMAELLRRLTTAVAEVSGHVNNTIAAELAGDVEVLTGELTRPAPRPRWYRTALDSILDTATTLGSVAAPVIEITKAISDAL